MKRSLTLILIISILFFALDASAKRKDGAKMEAEAIKLINEYVAKYEPLDLALRKSWFKYDTTGDKDASKEYGRIELEIKKLNADKARFARLKELRNNENKIEDLLIRRQIQLLYLWHLPNQISEDKLEKISALERALQEKFNDFRPSVDGKEMSSVEAHHIISDSTDTSLLEKVWKSEKTLGAVLENEFRELVKLRNAAAKELGYENTLYLYAAINEMEMKDLEKFYKDVRKATDKAFKQLKQDYIDPRLAKRYGIQVKELQPWHYQNSFFQEAPTAIFGEVDLDKFYEKSTSRDVINLAKKFYASIGVDISETLENSSLFPKPGKNPHAVAWFLDPNKTGSSVLIMNFPNPPKHPKASEVSTLVHELGHDVNYEAILHHKNLPYILRDPTMLTEAFAMLMEKQTVTPQWFESLGVDAKTAGDAIKTVELMDYVDQLIFLRWAATIFDFEKSFYENPDQNIGDLWWRCKEENQLLKRPEGWNNPDALAKYHIPIVSPLYYSNYAMGRVANVQFADLFAKKIGSKSPNVSYFGHKELGSWLMDDFLAQGLKYPWDEYLKMTTGQKLTLKPWKKYYIKGDFAKRLGI